MHVRMWWCVVAARVMNGDERMAPSYALRTLPRVHTQGVGRTVRMCTLGLVHTVGTHMANKGRGGRGRIGKNESNVNERGAPPPPRHHSPTHTVPTRCESTAAWIRIQG
jgi:hypothetical protein